MRIENLIESGLCLDRDTTVYLDACYCSENKRHHVVKDSSRSMHYL